jgi:uncharacterized protein
MSDDLLKPLGVDRPDRAARRFRPSAAQASGAALALGVLALGATAALRASPWTVERREPAPAQVQAVREPEPPRQADASARAPEPPAAETARRSAAEVEAAAGVSVVRPNGAAAPASVVIRVPEDAAVALAPAPDARLIERTRHGLLPRVGPDGSRPSSVYARPSEARPGGTRPVARVAILVGGLGLNPGATAEALAKLPAPVTLAFAPYGGDLERVVAQARENGHEVMLQVPMEPLDPAGAPGPQTLLADAKPQENLDRLHWAMGRFTGYTGLVNHMGAKLTADAAALAPILREVEKRGLVLLDDGSSQRSLIGRAEPAAGGVTARADVVLDGVPQAEAIDKALGALERTARERGFAVGTASALPVTLERLARWMRALEDRGILLVPVSAAFRRGAAR